MSITPISGEIKSQPLNDNFSFLASGVIQETGSNSNGEYIRFANGIQICYRSATVDLTSSESQNYTLPASFVTGGIVVGSWSLQPGPPISGDNSALQNAYVVATTSRFEFRNDGSGNSTSLDRLRLFAIGRWK